MLEPTTLHRASVECPLRLDSRNAATLMELLDHLNADGLTIVIITHDASVAAHAGRTVAISDGILSERVGTGHA